MFPARIGKLSCFYLQGIVLHGNMVMWLQHLIGAQAVQVQYLVLDMSLRTRFFKIFRSLKLQEGMYWGFQKCFKNLTLVERTQSSPVRLLL